MLSGWFEASYYILISAAVGIAGVLIVRLVASEEMLRKHNDVAAPIHAAIGVIYAVLLAFVISNVWDEFNNAVSAVGTEANQITALKRDITSFPPDVRSKISSALTSYTNTVLNMEWKLMETKGLDHFRNWSYDSLWTSTAGFEPRNEVERLQLASVFEHLAKLDEMRGKRKTYSESEIPKAMWILLYAGGAVTLLFAGLFGTENRRLQILMICALASIIGFMLFMIAAIDRPFEGIVSVEPEPFKHALENLQQLQN